MSTLKIKTNNTGKFNKSFNYTSEIGVIEFNEEGISEVDGKYINDILLMDSSLSLLEDTNINDSGQNDYKKELYKMSKDDLLELAKDSNLPSEEYETLTKKDLVEYLLAKTQE